MGKLGWTITGVGAVLWLLVPSAGVILALIWIGICIAFARGTHREVAKPSALPVAVTVGGHASPARAPRRDEYRPPPPRGKPTPPWSQRLTGFQVAGEFHYPDAVKQLAKRFIGGERGVMDGGKTTNVDAQLVPAAGNPYDSNAVAVYIDGLHVGYLERDDAAVYHWPIAQRTACGETVTVPSRQWFYLGYADGHLAGVMCQVTLRLPAPNGFAPEIGLPEDQHVVLPAGSTIQVTKEEEHMDTLAQHVASGVERPIAVTLHPTTEIRPRSSVDAVEVRLLGERVGVLTPTQTANVRPLVEYVEARGKVAVARGVLVGNQIKADVTLNVAKAQDVNQAWLDALGSPALPETATGGESWDDR